jgi:PAS domain S-box-containing protein
MFDSATVAISLLLLVAIAVIVVQMRLIRRMQGKASAETVSDQQAMDRQPADQLAEKPGDLFTAQHFRDLVDLAVDAILQGDPAGNIIGANRMALQLSGYTRDELIGMNIQRLFAPKELEAVPLRYDRLKGGEVVLNERMLTRKDGTQVLIEMNTKMMPNGTYQAFIRDCTERRQIRESLVQARHAAESANEAKSLFLANMSHEIRTPLNAVIGMNSILAERLEPGELRDLAKDAMSAANNLLDIISDVLDLSKIEAGKLELMEVVFEPRQIISQLERMFNPMMREKRLQFEISLATSVPECLIGDPARVQQIGVNLLSNAIKFTEFGTVKLQVAAAPVEDNRVELLLTVSDSGKGISPENMEQIFNPFVQENLTTTRKFGGTGLGLTISRYLAEMMGGSVLVESKVGQGSSFTCSVVCGVSEKKFPVRLAPESVPARTQPLKVLVAEDSVVNRKMMEAILRMEGHRATFAENGYEAVAAWQNNKFDLILMDIQMPEMDGVTATRQIRKAESSTGTRVPIIALTAYAMAGDKERFLSSGMDAYLAKPITVEQLRELLNKHGANNE